MPAISIIIPVYNVEKYLRRCLDSVLNQTFTDWQAICVNDGSPDNSDKILSEYAKKDKRFVIVNKENGGLSDARNVGMAHANGEYVLFLDSDDFIHPQTMEILYAQAQKHNVDMVSFRHDVKFHKSASALLNKGKNIDNIVPKLFNKKYDANRITGFLTNDILFHSTERNHTLSFTPMRRHCFPVLCMYRYDLISDIQFIRGIIFEDFPWWSLVMLRHPRTVMIDIPLYFYVPNATSILNTLRARRMIESLSTGLQTVYDIYSQQATDEEFRYYNHEFLWPFIITMMRVVPQLDNATDQRAARKVIKQLNKNGVFSMPSSRRARRYMKKIKNFIAA